MSREVFFKLDVHDDGTVKINKFSNAVDRMDKEGKQTIKTYDKFKGVMGGFTSKLKGAVGTVFNLKNALLGMAGAAGLGMVSKAFVNAASTAEQYRVRLEVLLGSTKEANRMFQDMTAYAAKVPHTYQEIMASATSLSGVMKGGVDEIKQYMPMIGDLAAVTGMSLQETTGQVIRMYSAGAAAADMFRERGITAMMGFKAGVHYSTEETRKMMFESWNKTDSQFKGATDKLGKTWKGLTSMMADRWFQVRNKVMDAGLFDKLKGGLDSVIKKIDELDKSGRLDTWAKNMGDAVLALVGVLGQAAKMINYITENTMELIRIVKNWSIFGGTGPFQPPDSELPLVKIGGEEGPGVFEKMFPNKAIDELKEKVVGFWDEFENNLPDIAESISDEIGDSLSNLLVDWEMDWKDLGKSVSRIFADVFADMAKKKYIQPMVDNIVSGISSGFAKSSQGMSQEAIAYGGIGYGAGKGAAASSTPWLAQVGAYATMMQEFDMWKMTFQADASESLNLVDKFSKVFGMGGPDPIKEKIKPNIELMFETIDDVVTLATQKWTELAQDDRLVDAIREFYQNQFDFFNTLNLMLGNLNFTLENMDISASPGDIEAQIQKAPIQYAMENIESIKGVFGDVVPEIEDMFMETFGPWHFYKQVQQVKDPEGWHMGTGRIYDAWASQTDIEGDLEKILAGEKAYADFIKQTVTVFQGGHYASDPDIKHVISMADIIQGSDIEAFQDFLQPLRDQVDKFNAYFTEGLGDVFANTLQTGGFSSFMDGLRAQIGMNVKKAFLEGIIPNFAQRMMGPLFDSFGLGGIIDRAIKGITEGTEGAPSINDAVASLKESFDSLDFTEIQPLFEALAEGIFKLDDAFGLNTEAIGSNTDALIGPLESLMNDLTYGALAPGQSLEGLQSVYDELLAGATLSPEGISDFASFAGGTYLPGMEPFDYTSITEQVKMDVGSLLAQYNGGTTDLGQSIAEALGPALASMGGEQVIHAHIYINGKEVASEVLTEIENSSELTQQTQGIVN